MFALMIAVIYSAVLCVMILMPKTRDMEASSWYRVACASKTSEDVSDHERKKKVLRLQHLSARSLWLLAARFTMSIVIIGNVSEQISTGTLWRMKPGSAWFIQPMRLKIPFDMKSSCYISWGLTFNLQLEWWLITPQEGLVSWEGGWHWVVYPEITMIGNPIARSCSVTCLPFH